MKKTVQLGLSFMTIFLLSACGSHDNTPLKLNDDLNTVNQKINSHILELNDTNETRIERYKIVVLPTQIDSKIQNMVSFSLNRLSDSISSALYETERFDILVNEDEIADVEENNDLAHSADFYLQSTLSQLDTEQTIGVLLDTGQKVDEKIVVATVVYQIIDAKSNKVILNRPLTYQLKSTTSNESFNYTVLQTLDVMANLIKNEIINEIYPIRLVSATDDKEIILDYPLPLGSQCEVFHLGKKVNNIYTGSLLGYQQSPVGKLVVIHSTSVLAYGEMLDGHAAKGDICKPIQTKLAMPELVTQTPQNSAVFPFDSSR